MKNNDYFNIDELYGVLLELDNKYLFRKRPDEKVMVRVVIPECSYEELVEQAKIVKEYLEEHHNNGDISDNDYAYAILEQENVWRYIRFLRRKGLI